MTLQHFDATAEIAEMKQRRQDQKRKKYRRSVGDYREELIVFLKQGGSLRLAREWLLTKKKFKTSHTTIMRFIKKLPEFKEIEDAKLP